MYIIVLGDIRGPIEAHRAQGAQAHGRRAGGGQRAGGGRRQDGGGGRTMGDRNIHRNNNMVVQKLNLS